jgi:hypothetical protein
MTTLPYTVEEIGWYAAGWAVFMRDVRDPSFFPPLNDIEAQREWLGGFGAAWDSDGSDEESVDAALVRVMEGKDELLRQLRSHRAGWGSRELH